MGLDLVTVLGLCAGTLTTISFIPQVVKTWRTRSGADLSTSMFALFSLGLVLWFAYGVMIDSLPIIVANGVTLALTLLVLVLKYRFRNRC